MSAIPMGDLPSFHAKRFEPSKWCVRHGESLLTWSELDLLSTRRAWALKEKGVGQDDLVVLSLPNCNELYELTFAIWKLGATPSVVSWRLPPREFAAILDVARPKLLIASDPKLMDAFGALPPDYGRCEGKDEPLAARIATHWKAMTSGGSTGRPKLIVDHLPSVFDPATQPLFMPSDKVALNPGPCYHNAPFSGSHTLMFRGNSVVGMAKFEPEEALRLMNEFNVAWVFLVPTMMGRIWQLPEDTRKKYDLSSLEHVWHGASSMPPWLKENWIRWLGPDRVWELYGGTEAQGTTLIGGHDWLTHRGSVGKPARCKIRILSEDGKDLPPGEVGEIYFGSDGAPRSTYHYLGAKPRVGPDGYESIGDFGWLDKDGFLYIADRRTDMIVSGGANIYPAEIESALLEHPAVLDAVVIGLPDDDMGARAHAVIRPRMIAHVPTEDELRDFLAHRLVRYKIPRSFEFTNEPLRDDAGKVRRTQLRDERVLPRQGACATQ